MLTHLSAVSIHMVDINLCNGVRHSSLPIFHCTIFRSCISLGWVVPPTSRSFFFLLKSNNFLESIFCFLRISVSNELDQHATFFELFSPINVDMFNFLKDSVFRRSHCMFTSRLIEWKEISLMSSLFRRFITNVSNNPNFFTIFADWNWWFAVVSNFVEKISRILVGDDCRIYRGIFTPPFFGTVVDEVTTSYKKKVRKSNLASYEKANKHIYMYTYLSSCNNRVNDPVSEQSLCCLAHLGLLLSDISSINQGIAEWHVWNDRSCTLHCFPFYIQGKTQ